MHVPGLPVFLCRFEILLSRDLSRSFAARLASSARSAALCVWLSAARASNERKNARIIAATSLLHSCRESSYLRRAFNGLLAIAILQIVLRPLQQLVVVHCCGWLKPFLFQNLLLRSSAYSSYIYMYIASWLTCAVYIALYINGNIQGASHARTRGRNRRKRKRADVPLWFYAKRRASSSYTNSRACMWLICGRSCCWKRSKKNSQLQLRLSVFFFLLASADVNDVLRCGREMSHFFGSTSSSMIPSLDDSNISSYMQFSSWIFFLSQDLVSVSLHLTTLYCTLDFCSCAAPPDNCFFLFLSLYLILLLAAVQKRIRFVRTRIRINWQNAERTSGRDVDDAVRLAFLHPKDRQVNAHFCIYFMYNP